MSKSRNKRVIVDNFVFLITDCKDHIQKCLCKGKYYEHKMISYIQKHYNGGRFIDIGACFGNHTLAFSRVADKVESFEPEASLMLLLSTNVMINVQPDKVGIHHTALGNKIGFAKFELPSKKNCGQGRITSTGITHIPITTLDSYKFSDVTLIKIDVEGYELEVLKGAKKTIKSELPDMFIECATKSSKEEVTKFLQSINENYKDVKKFNATPTYLFTIKPETKNGKEEKKNWFFKLLGIW